MCVTFNYRWKLMHRNCKLLSHDIQGVRNELKNVIFGSKPSIFIKKIFSKFSIPDLEITPGMNFLETMPPESLPLVREKMLIKGERKYQKGRLDALSRDSSRGTLWRSGASFDRGWHRCSRDYVSCTCVTVYVYIYLPEGVDERIGPRE